MRTATGYGFILATLLAASAAAQEQPEISPANKLYQQGVIEGERAWKLERRGKKQAAVDAHELAGQLSEASIARSATGSLLPLRHLISSRGPIARVLEGRWQSQG